MTLSTAVFFPLFMLLIVPFILGLPHILASMRYASRAIGSQSQNTSLRTSQVAAVLAVALVVVAALKFWIKTHGSGSVYYLSELESTNQVELTAVVAAMFILFSDMKLSLGRCLAVFLGFLPFLTFAAKFPVATVGGLHIAHNFVGFFYWCILAKQRGNPREYHFSILATSLFTLVHVLLFMGYFDFLLSWSIHLPIQDSFIRWLNPVSVGSSIAPWIEQLVNVDQWSMWCKRLLFAYAFGQSLHYYIWIRCVAEQELHREVPVTFRQSFGLLKRDVGSCLAKIMIFAVIIISSAWLVTPQETLRLVYISIGSLHGYIEILGLTFLVMGHVKFKPRNRHAPV